MKTIELTEDQSKRLHSLVLAEMSRISQVLDTLKNTELNDYRDLKRTYEKEFNELNRLSARLLVL